MKIKYLLILLFNSLYVSAQQVHIMGEIVDVQTNLPVAAATISIVEKNLFYPANNNGEFDIASKQLMDTDSLRFSCIGYKTMKIRIGDMLLKGVVKLFPMINILGEVKINLPPLINVGCKDDEGKKFTAEWAGLDQATFMEGSANVKGIINTIGFYLSSGKKSLSGGDVTAPFRIRLFYVDTNGMPGNEITKEVIIVSAKKNNAWFDVDLSAYHIQNPDSGFFASFTLLNYEYYQLRKGAKGTDEFGRRYEFGVSNSGDLRTPRLSVISGSKQPKSYFSVARSLDNWEWHWVKDYFDLCYMIRATIAKD
jgi:hypothetical protein